MGMCHLDFGRECKRAELFSSFYIEQFNRIEQVEVTVWF